LLKIHVMAVGWGARGCGQNGHSFVQASRRSYGVVQAPNFRKSNEFAGRERLFGTQIAPRFRRSRSGLAQSEDCFTSHMAFCCCQLGVRRMRSDLPQSGRPAWHRLGKIGCPDSRKVRRALTPAWQRLQPLRGRLRSIAIGVNVVGAVVVGRIAKPLRNRNRMVARVDTRAPEVGASGAPFVSSHVRLSWQAIPFGGPPSHPNRNQRQGCGRWRRDPDCGVDRS
jgi:hypothetical protein